MITGDDLIGAAEGIRAQVKMMEDAPEVAGAASIDAAIEAIFQQQAINDPRGKLPIVRR